jgi:glutamate-ammonia-ligase adenylyltransferase
MINPEESIRSLELSSPYISMLLSRNEALRLEMYNIIEGFNNGTLEGVIEDPYSLKYPFPPEDAAPESLKLRSREIKNRELALIALKDFLKIYTVKDTIESLSRLADFCIDYSVKSLLAGSGNDLLRYKSLVENLIIIGMGKLGGNELNISSDIDLVFLVGDSDDYTGALLTGLLDFISSTTSEGFLYRVDMRLRPEGGNGPLFMRAADALDYYRDRARKWELQAMIKKRLVWGSAVLFDEFSTRLDDIIYSHHQPHAILYDIKRTKDLIETNIRSRNLLFEIKQSPGGIRDIEFIIQFLQLIHGIRYPEFKNPNSLTALSLLSTFHIITPGEFSILHSSYITLRKIENIIQLKNNTPEHSLPADDKDIETLFRPWRIDGFDSGTDNYSMEFKARLQNIMKEVREIFTYLFDETIHYLELKDNLLAGHPDIDRELLSDHFLRMDSEYFLSFSEDNIYSHLMMISKLDIRNPALIKAEKTGPGRWELTIVAFDYYYEFSKIAGLVSAYYLKIISGESFTYGGDSGAFYRRQEKRIYPYSPPAETGGLIYRRKIVCFLTVEEFENHHEPDWDNFRKELSFILSLLENNRAREAEEFLNNKILGLISLIQSGETPSIAPVEIGVDNVSSSRYTILNISSGDSFAFLYTFTNVLALYNYYIFKIEIDTSGERVFDRLFILTRDGKKILETREIENLKIAAALIKQYSTLLQNAVNPDKALLYFDELLMRVLESGDKKELPILGQKDVQEKLAAVFGIGDYFWEDLIRLQYTDMLPVLSDPVLKQHFTREQLTELFLSELSGQTGKVREGNFSILLNDWKDREMFRIDIRQILKMTGMAEFSLELTDLAESVIDIAMKKIDKEMQKTGGMKKVPAWAVFGLGKLGGRELGYASDIEIMFIYDDDPEESTRGNNDMVTYYEKYMQDLLKIIRSKREGIFEIDLNLRPYGKSSRIPVSKSVFLEYFREGKAYYFEKQAMVKLRPICGGNAPESLIKDIISGRDLFVYSGIKPDINALYKLREKQIGSYIKKPGLTNIKYSKGCLVDIEYLVQTLQIACGKDIPAVRCESTLDSIEALFKTGVIDENSWGILNNGYLFFRNLINILRMVKGNAKDLSVYPQDSAEYDYLVKRSYFVGIIDEKSPVLLKNTIDKHRQDVSSVFENEIRKLQL